MFKWLTKVYRPQPEAVRKVVPEDFQSKLKGLSTILKRSDLKPSYPKPGVRTLRGVGTLEVVSPKQPTPDGFRAVECWEVGRSKPTIYLVPEPGPSFISGGGGDFGGGGATSSWSPSESSSSSSSSDSSSSSSSD